MVDFHTGGHGYAVSRDVAESLVAAFRTGALYHHLHEDTNFGLWMLGLSVKRVNLRAMAATRAARRRFAFPST